MKQLERSELVDRIGREIQARMGFRDIDGFLAGFGVDVSKPTSNVNSKWVYTKELLVGVPEETIVRIANELDIPHNRVLLPAALPAQSSFWLPGYFRLFLSHLSSFKVQTGALQKALRRYAISGFVAHVDIEPTREWQREIEVALFSMDALAALLMPGFKESAWTEQEVGVAIGRGCLVIPVMRGLDPYGLMGKIQGVQANGRTVGAVARDIFGALLASDQTRSKVLSCLVEATCRASAVQDAQDKLEILEGVSVTAGVAAALGHAATQSPLILHNDGLLEVVNRILKSQNLPALSADGETGEMAGDDDLPF